jgi:electron transport complex protein RnfE
MTFVLLMSEVVIACFRRLIPDSIRIPVFIIVIAAFTTVIDYALKAWFPALSRAMGVFIPLIVVNCIIMGRVESFASKRPPAEAALDAAGMGLGYTWVLAGISLARELLGAGTVFGAPVLPPPFEPVLFFVLPPGGFFMFALFISLNTAIKRRLKPPAAGEESAPSCGHCGAAPVCEAAKAAKETA